MRPDAVNVHADCNLADAHAGADGRGALDPGGFARSPCCRGCPWWRRGNPFHRRSKRRRAPRPGRISINRARVRVSRPLPGSSRSSASGSMASTAASDTRRFSPPESLNVMRSSNPCSPRGQGAEGDGDGFGLGLAEIERAEGDVLQHGRAEELIVGVLEKQPDPAAHLREVLFLPRFLAEEGDPAGDRLQEPHDDVEEGGLGTAVGGDDADAIAAAEREIEDRPNTGGPPGYLKVMPFRSMIGVPRSRAFTALFSPSGKNSWIRIGVFRDPDTYGPGPDADVLRCIFRRRISRGPFGPGSPGGQAAAAGRRWRARPPTSAGAGPGSRPRP